MKFAVIQDSAGQKKLLGLIEKLGGDMHRSFSGILEFDRLLKACGGQPLETDDEEEE